MWFKHALNAKQPIAMRPERQATHSSTPFYTVEITQHALKGQKLLAQGSASKQHALKGIGLSLNIACRRI